MKEKLIIIGNGGHSKVVQSIVNQVKKYKLIEIWDNKFKNETIDNGILYKSIPSSIVSNEENLKYFIAIGDNLTRKKFSTQLGIPIDKYATIIHPKAIVDSKSFIKQGSLIMGAAVLQADSIVGYHSIVNSNAVVEHDTVIEDFVHIGPSTTVTGNCFISKYAFLGAGSVLVPKVTIGKHTIIGAGSVVTKSISDNTIAYGNPAKEIKNKN